MSRREYANMPRAAQEQMKECTFQPDTIERRNKKLLNNLVKQRESGVPQEYRLELDE